MRDTQKKKENLKNTKEFCKVVTKWNLEVINENSKVIKKYLKVTKINFI